MTFRELLSEGTRYLQECQIADASIDAWQLMEFVWNINRSYYFIHSDDIIIEEKQQQYRKLLKKRGMHVPLQYITHRAYFMGLDFYVNENVLIPRQDTETLVETVLQQIPDQSLILDMCTGSGCILLSILNEKKNSAGTGADVSEAALAVAKKNSEALGIKAEFIQSDLFEAVDGDFDVIVSNPPYIPSGDISGLMEEVKLHEPVRALDGKEDGLYFYRKIISGADGYLRAGGLLAFEIGCDQGEAVQKMMSAAGYKKVRITKDLAGLDRVVTGYRK